MTTRQDQFIPKSAPALQTSHAIRLTPSQEKELRRRYIAGLRIASRMVADPMQPNLFSMRLSSMSTLPNFDPLTERVDGYQRLYLSYMSVHRAIEVTKRGVPLRLQNPKRCQFAVRGQTAIFAYSGLPDGYVQLDPAQFTPESSPLDIPVTAFMFNAHIAPDSSIAWSLTVHYVSRYRRAEQVNHLLAALTGEPPAPALPQVHMFTPSAVKEQMALAALEMARATPTPMPDLPLGVAPITLPDPIDTVVPP